MVISTHTKRLSDALVPLGDYDANVLEAHDLTDLVEEGRKQRNSHWLGNRGKCCLDLNYGH
jgi:hypothetical protein